MLPLSGFPICFFKFPPVIRIYWQDSEGVPSPLFSSHTSTSSLPQSFLSLAKAQSLSFPSKVVRSRMSNFHVICRSRSGSTTLVGRLFLADNLPRHARCWPRCELVRLFLFKLQRSFFDVTLRLLSFSPTLANSRLLSSIPPNEKNKPIFFRRMSLYKALLFFRALELRGLPSPTSLPRKAFCPPSYHPRVDSRTKFDPFLRIAEPLSLLCPKSVTLSHFSVFLYSPQNGFPLTRKNRISILLRPGESGLLCRKS